MRKIIIASAVAFLAASSAIAGNSQTYNCHKQPDENGFSADRCSNDRTGNNVSAARAEKERAEAAAASK
jgi:hypothetical protein